MIRACRVQRIPGTGGLTGGHTLPGGRNADIARAVGKVRDSAEVARIARDYFAWVSVSAGIPRERWGRNVWTTVA